MFLWPWFLDYREKYALLLYVDRFNFILQIFNTHKIYSKKSLSLGYVLNIFLKGWTFQRQDSYKVSCYKEEKMYQRKEIDISNLETRQPYVRTQARPKNIILEVHFPFLKDYKDDGSSVSLSLWLSD